MTKDHIQEIFECGLSAVKFTKVRYRGIAKNLHKLNVLFACTNLLMYAYATKHSVQPVG